MTDRRFALAEHLLRDEAVAAVRDGRDGPPTGCTTGSGSTWTPSTASTSPAARYEQAILDYHRHVDGLIGAAARARGRRHGRPRPLRPRREAARGRDPRQRVAAARGPAHARWPSPTASARRATSGSTGRRRSPGARAATTRASSSTSQGASRTASIPAADYERVRDELAARSGAIPDDEGRPDGDARLQAGGALRGGERRRSRPDRRSSATCSGARSGRSAATRACTRSRTTRARTTRTTPRTGMYVVAGAGDRRARRARRCTCSTSHRPCSSCSGSKSPRGSGGQVRCPRSGRTWPNRRGGEWRRASLATTQRSPGSRYAVPPLTVPDRVKSAAHRVAVAGCEG